MVKKILMKLHTNGWVWGQGNLGELAVKMREVVYLFD